MLILFGISAYNRTEIIVALFRLFTGASTVH